MRRLIPVVAVVSALAWPAGAAAAPEPIPVVEVDRGDVHNPKPFAAPDGGQLVSWQGQGADVGQHLAERGNAGGPFGQPFLLSATPNSEPLSISFTPDSGFYAVWGISTSNAPAESTTRTPDGTFSPVSPIPGCNRFVDSASGPDGGVAMACRYRLMTNPPDTVSWGSSPTLGPVTPTEELTPAAYSSFLRPFIEWGPDGTIAIVAQGYSTTTNPPPANETTRIRVALRGPAPFATADIAFATWPQEVDAGPPLVLDDGTVAVPLSGSEGARMAIRPPGALSTFSMSPLQGEGIWGAGLGASQNLHVASGISDDREYWSFVKPPGLAVGTANPIPMPTIAGGGDAYLTAFEVAPDGTEYAGIRGDDGTYVSSRSPGQSFTTPVKIGNDSSSNPRLAVTRDGDLLVTWSHSNGPNDQTINLSGLDKTPPEVVVNSFPEEVADGTAASFSASATDAMGIASLVWNFDGETVPGGDATHTFMGTGNHRVSFTATDVAGQRTVVTKTVTVPVGPDSDPVMTLKTPKKLQFRALARRGVRVVVTGRPKIRIRATIGTSRRNARMRPMRVRVVKKFRNRHVIRIKPRRARLGKRRSFRLFVQVTGTTMAGKRATRTRTVKIRR